MLTKVILKISLFSAVITFTLCMVTDISLGASASRAIIVFAGFYVILIGFFVIVRLIFDPKRMQAQLKKEAREEIEEAEAHEVAEVTDGRASATKEVVEAETAGVTGE